MSQSVSFTVSSFPLPSNQWCLRESAWARPIQEAYMKKMNKVFENSLQLQDRWRQIEWVETTQILKPQALVQRLLLDNFRMTSRLKCSRSIIVIDGNNLDTCLPVGRSASTDPLFRKFQWSSTRFIATLRESRLIRLCFLSYCHWLTVTNWLTVTDTHLNIILSLLWM